MPTNTTKPETTDATAAGTKPPARRRSGASGGKPLVIVESPTKANKIAGYLGSGYVVEASVGHIRDLPRNAADVPGRLAADAVVLLGSPGMEDDAASLEALEIYDAGPLGDPVAALGWFGRPPGAGPYGSNGLPVDTWTGHSEYFDADHPTVAAIGEVITGARCPG